MKIGKLPQNDLTNGWSAILPAREPHETLAGDVTADWLVIGGGYAGLSAARRLAENRPEESVVLVEAGVCRPELLCETELVAVLPRKL